MTIPPRSAEAPHRQPRTALALAAVGCIAALALGCVAFVLLRGVVGGLSRTEGEGIIVPSWPRAAGAVSIAIYEPAAPPPGAGRPEIVAFGEGNAAQVVRASYPNGLLLAETNRESDEVALAPEVAVPGADEAWRVPVDGRPSLVLRRGGTWISLRGASEEELLRVAGSLRLVEE